jgi:peptide-methionine (S)-S-oxide reductase
MKTHVIIISLITVLFQVCLALEPGTFQTSGQGKSSQQLTRKGMQLDTATFAAGCFWCVEAIYQNVKGVHKVISGFSGGKVKNPTYEEVCTGTTGHAEACQILYDPKEVSFVDLLEIFWKTHDPTTLNRQGNDVGTQYRSAVFYHNQEQKQLAEEYRKKLDKSGIYDSPVVTEIIPYTNFYKAEDYHQNYFNDNRDQPYCRLVIQPKLDKFTKIFKDKLSTQK